MQNDRTHVLVMVDGVMFCVVVTHVVGPWGPKNVKLFLVDSVLDPIESHVNGFGSDLFALTVGNCDGC